MNRFVRFSLTVLLLGTVATEATGQRSYRLLPLAEVPGQVDVYATGINNRGQTVGYIVDAQGDSHAVLWTDSGVELLPELTAADSFSQAFRINDAGQIIGKSRTEDGPLHATLWEDGNVIDIGTVDGAVESFATDINQQGVVVGSSIFGADSVAFRWTKQEGFKSYSPGPGRLANAGFNGINSDGLMVGTTFVLLEPFRAAFARPDDTVVTDLSPPGRNLGMALAVNDAGTIVGYQGVDSASPQATIFHTDGTLQPLGTLGLEESWAQDVNEDGTIVGRAFSFSEGGLIPKAFVFADGQIFDLSDLAVNPRGWELIEAAAINDRGWIAGNGLLDGSVRAFVALPVPEPTTCAMVLWGTLSVVLFRRAVATG